MKVLSVFGYSTSGKTTTIEEIIKELRRRGYTVGSVKDIHYDEFAIDTEGSNTFRHKQAGSMMVTARGKTETDVLFQRTLAIDEILDFYHYDYVVIEGNCNANVPMILVGKDMEQLEKKEASLGDGYQDLIIAISGVISNQPIKYKDIPVINALTEIERLVDLIEEKVPHRMPNFSKDCCTACGTDCRGLLARVLKGTGSVKECTLQEGNTKLVINGEEIQMVPFVKTILRDVVLGTVKNLDGYQEHAEIVVKIS